MMLCAFGHVIQSTFQAVPFPFVFLHLPVYSLLLKALDSDTVLVKMIQNCSEILRGFASVWVGRRDMINDKACRPQDRPSRACQRRYGSLGPR